MVNAGWQLWMKRPVERLISTNRRYPVTKAGEQLHALGFVEPGADQVATVFEYTGMELCLEILPDNDRTIHS